MIKISADKIYTGNGSVLSDTAIVCDRDGKVLDLVDIATLDRADVKVYKGWLVPGFVNTHCHLELSHMKGVVPTGLGLIPFITDVVQKRNASPEVIQEAIEKAEQQMIDTGIVAVGDISNSTDTFSQKNKGKLRYHTFVELFDFLQNDQASSTFENYLKVYEGARSSRWPYQIPHSSCTLFGF